MVETCSPSPDVEAYAALDLGTNSCRLLVGAPTVHGFRVLDSFSRMVRLGEGLHHSGTLCDGAMARTIDALHGCAARLTRRRLRGVRAIATEACRSASNGAAFLDRIRTETGLAFEVISTREEAELALESCAPLLAPLAASGTRRALLFDIGGGSTELAWVRLIPDGPPVLAGYVSLQIGVASLVERLASDGFEAVVEQVRHLLEPFERIHRIGQEVRQGDVVFVGTSGTATTLAGVALGLPRYRRPLIDGTVLTALAVDDAVGRLRALSARELGCHPCIGAERAGFVLPGCAILQAICETWPGPEILVADRGLRDGMLLRMMRVATPTRRGHVGRHAAALGMAAAIGPSP